MRHPLSHPTGFAGDETATASDAASNDPEVSSTGEPEATTVGMPRADWSVVRKHQRYLSEWEDDKVVVNVAHHKATSIREKTIDLAKFHLDCTGEGIYEGLMPLTHFRNLVDALKYAINTCLERHHLGDIAATVGPKVYGIIRIYIWMLRDGKYNLADVRPSDTDDLALQLSTRSWDRLLRHNRCLIKLLLRLREQPLLARPLVGSAHTDYASLRIDEVERAVGLPAPWVGYPNWFRKRVRLIAEDPRAPKKLVRRESPERVYELAATMQSLNDLAGHREGGDCIALRPFPSVMPTALRMAPVKAGRTPNIELADFLALMGESLKWMYDRRDAFVDLLSDTRAALIEETRAVGKSNDPAAVRARVSRRVAKLYAESNVDGIFPYDSISLADGPASICGMTKTAQSAAFTVIASNHGRRTNEVIGKGVPYGLSIGSLRSVGDGYKEWTIEFYVEKTIQDYDEFLANEFIADAVSFLMDIYDALRGLDEQPLMVPSNREAARHCKLFTHRNLTPEGMAGPRIEHNVRSDMDEFFRLAKVDQSKFNNQQLPYRRMFASLQIHRYDCPEPMAVKRALRHFSPVHSRSYYTDAPDGRTTGRITTVMAKRRREAEQMERAMRDARSDYLAEMVATLFQGEPVGGYFPRLVLHLAKRLSASATFVESSFGEKVERITSTLEQRGYGPNVLPHGPCMADNPIHTLKSSNCYRDGQLHREEASPATCATCIHHSNNDIHRQEMQDDANKSRAASQDFLNPPAVRAKHLAHAERMEQLIADERALGEETQLAYAQLVETWSNIFGAE